MRFALSIAALGAVLLVGCNKSPEGGQPGTNNSFTFSLPTIPPTVKQGQKETVHITLNPDSGFNQTVKLKVDVPDNSNIKAQLNKDTIAPSDPKEVSLTLEVGKDVPTGDHAIKVTATPDKGTATTKEFKVKVETP
jgi:uncharacterized membrane protein